MLQKRYEGFLKTPCLWQNNDVFDMLQFEITTSPSKINIAINEKLRLGKYIERFVSYELEQQTNISILAENIQIKENKITLGELDCLLIKNKQPIHLEVIYKFYLYDASVGNNELDHFIGPNRKDTLIEKLVKLKDKQLPLLYSNACKPYLDAFGLKANNVVQQVYFKAQLFLPFNSPNIPIKILNSECVVGLYITIKDLPNFSNCKFYIPYKKDWLIIPHPNVPWKSHEEFYPIALGYVQEKFSTLLWVKHNNGAIKKLFYVWW